MSESPVRLRHFVGLLTLFNSCTLTCGVGWAVCCLLHHAPGCPCAESNRVLRLRESRSYPVDDRGDGRGRIRTRIARLRSPALCPLSYASKPQAGIEPASLLLTKQALDP